MHHWLEEKQMETNGAACIPTESPRGCSLASCQPTALLTSARLPPLPVPLPWPDLSPSALPHLCPDGLFLFLLYN